MTPTTWIGIDIAAQTLAVAFSPAPQATHPARSYPNTPTGWRQLANWLGEQGAEPATTRAIMEATGAYWQGVALALAGAGWGVSVVTPSSVHHYARARLQRAKTDAVDAAVLARYGWDLQPAPWTPAPADVQALRVLIRQRDDLIALQTETRNRQHALRHVPHVPVAATAAIQAVLTTLAEQIVALEAAIQRQATSAPRVAAASARLQTVVGVGLLTAAVVVAETHARWATATPAQVVAYAGLDPAPRESGTSVRGSGRISKTGNARLRQALYMAALTATRFNPPLRAFYERSVARGKPKQVARVAAARKLLVLLITLLQRQRDFDPTWAATHPSRRRP